MNSKRVWPQIVSATLIGAWVFVAEAQINTGSDGRDGALTPNVDTVINMTDHPDGIYQYTSVHIPANVTVSFIPNAKNTPVVWLVQNDLTCDGKIVLDGQPGSGAKGGLGGPGAWAGGSGAPAVTTGEGPGGGGTGCNADHAGFTYGNEFLIPLLGGSGGGGSTCGSWGGGGGGGAILIAAGGEIKVVGQITAKAGTANGSGYSISDTRGGDGCGGAIRLVSSTVSGTGLISTRGGNHSVGQVGRVRFDRYQSSFAGTIEGTFTQGLQPIILPAAGQFPQLDVISVGGFPVSAPPTGILSTPDALISAQQANPIPVVVQCSNVPLNTRITVTLKPMNGGPVTGVGYNNTGTLATSKATVAINVPRGGGIIYATATTPQ
ncbi:MAG: hypothetical protein U1G07_27655 [Verrucomicrobiota bacterium]